MKVKAELEVYEKNGKEFPDCKIEVRSHWSRQGHGGLVVLVIGETEYAVGSSELMEATKRCSGF